MKSFSRALLIMFAFFAVGVAMLTVSSIAVRSLDKKSQTPAPPTPTNQPIVKPTCPRSEAEFQSLVDAGQFVQVLQNEGGYAVGGKIVKAPADRSVIRTGEIACGYLYVRAERSSGKPLDTKSDSVSINPNDRGGHLFRPQSIVSDSATETRILFPLDNIRFKATAPYTTDPENTNLQTANWVYLLDSGDVTTFRFLLSTLSKQALLKEVVLAYKCQDAVTGAENHECALQLLPQN